MLSKIDTLWRAQYSNPVYSPPYDEPRCGQYSNWCEDGEAKDECCSECCMGVATRPYSPSFRCLALLFSLALFLIVVFALLRQNDQAVEAVPVNTTHAALVLTNLCSSFHDGVISGDLCNRLCYFDNITLAEFYTQHKTVAVLLIGGQKFVLKSKHDFYYNFKLLPASLSDAQFLEAIVERVNEKLQLDWPKQRAERLLDLVWPVYKRTSVINAADRLSLWTLVNQDEYLTYTLLSNAHVFPRVIGSCGHFYAVEQLVPFKLETILYSNVKSKVLIHLMGTLKLLTDFMNEPLHWCDVRFENLGLSANYPKRFIVMDADHLYTDYRVKNMLGRTKCQSDKDCTFGDCDGSCDTNVSRCVNRTNDNIDVFCNKLVMKLFGPFWTKANRFMAACHNTAITREQRLAEMRSTWAWSLSDI